LNELPLLLSLIIFLLLPLLQALCFCLMRVGECPCVGMRVRVCVWKMAKFSNKEIVLSHASSNNNASCCGGGNNKQTNLPF